MSRRAGETATLPATSTASVPDGHDGDWRLRILGDCMVLFAVLVSVVLWWQGHPAILAPAAAVLGVAMPLSRRLPVPAAATAALTLVVGFYLAAAVGLGLMQVSVPLDPTVALGVLLAPCLGAVVDLAMRRSPASPDETSASHLAQRAIVVGAVVGPALFLLVVGIAIARYGEGALAFAMSGDARNHLLLGRVIMSQGGIGGAALAAGPALSDSVLALTMAIPGRGVAAPDQLLAKDIQALTALLVSATIAWSLACACLVWAVGRLDRVPQAFAVAAASVIPLAGIGLGIALKDGYFSAVFAMPLLISALCLSTWLARDTGRRRGRTITWIAIALSLPVAATVWSLMLPIQAMVVLGALIASHRRSNPRDTLAAAGIVAVALAAAVLLLLPLALGPSMAAMTAGGSIAAPGPALSVTVVLIVLSIVAAGLPRIRRSVFLPYLLGTLGAVAIVLYLAAKQPPGMEWAYYPRKVAWMWVLVGFPLLLAPAAFVHARPRAGPRRSRFFSTVLAAAGSLAVLSLAAGSVRVSSPLLPSALVGLSPGAQTPGGAWSILRGWGQPDWQMVETVLRLGASNRPLVIWAYSDPGNDRLGNFWMSTYDPAQPPGSGTYISPLGGWAYGYNPTDVTQLCTLLDQDPLRNVATRDASLPSTVNSQCGLPADRVWVVP
jgi:hypothetical protein